MTKLYQSLELKPNEGQKFFIRHCCDHFSSIYVLQLLHLKGTLLNTVGIQVHGEIFLEPRQVNEVVTVPEVAGAIISSECNKKILFQLCTETTETAVPPFF